MLRTPLLPLATLSILLASSAASAEPSTPSETGAKARPRLLVLGAIAAAAGSTGVTLASHWASPLDGRQRLIAGLSGAALMALAIPLIKWSSGAARERDEVDDPAPRAIEERLVLSVGGLALAGASSTADTWLTGSVEYQLASSRLRLAVDTQLAALGDRALAVTAGPSFHVARLPIVSVSTGGRVGLEWGASARPIAELVSELQVEVPFAPVKPRLTMRYQVGSQRTWRHRVLFGASLALML